MGRIFITGSADGLGLMAAKLLIKEGHEVLLHARNKSRAADALAAAPGALSAVTGDLSVMKEVKDVAGEVNSFGIFDAVIHNAAVGYREPKIITPEGLPQVFAVNSLAPYILTVLINRPKRLIYLSSGLHKSGDAGLNDLTWMHKPWNGFNAYADSKLHDLLLAFAISRRWPSVYSNALEPGWVATKMGGAGAPDSIEEGPKTQAWLAVSDEPAACVTGKYFFHKKEHPFLAEAKDEKIQDQLILEFARISGLDLPV